MPRGTPASQKQEKEFSIIIEVSLDSTVVLLSRKIVGLTLDIVRVTKVMAIEDTEVVVETTGKDEMASSNSRGRGQNSQVFYYSCG